MNSTAANTVVEHSEIHGRGVFATRAFRPGEIIEVAQVIVFGPDDLAAIDATVLYGYYFTWGEGGALALGNGSLYNHAGSPNARYECQEKHGIIVFTAIEPIDKGAEITVDYLSRADPGSKLWFVPTGTLVPASA